MKKENKQVEVLTVIFSAFLAFMCWLQSSQYTFNQFDNQCRETNYESCMRWFWETKGFFQKAEIISIIVLVISLILIIRKKRR